MKLIALLICIHAIAWSQASNENFREVVVKVNKAVIYKESNDSQALGFYKEGKVLKASKKVYNKKFLKVQLENEIGHIHVNDLYTENNHPPEEFTYQPHPLRKELFKEEDKKIIKKSYGQAVIGFFSPGTDWIDLNQSVASEGSTTGFYLNIRYQKFDPKYIPLVKFNYGIDYYSIGGSDTSFSSIAAALDLDIKLMSFEKLRFEGVLSYFYSPKTSYQVYSSSADVSARGFRVALQSLYQWNKRTSLMAALGFQTLTPDETQVQFFLNGSQRTLGLTGLVFSGTKLYFGLKHEL